MEKDEIQVYSSYGAAIQSVKEHEIATNTKFISVARTKNALVTDVPYVEDHVVRFEDLRGEVPVIYDGVPFVQVGTEVRECHQGPIRKNKEMITGQPTKQARKETIQRVKEAMLEENDQQYSVYVRYCGQHHDHATGGIKTRQSVQCKSLEDALGVLKQHEAEHKYKYSTIKATKGFGNIDIRYGKKIFWEDKKSIIHGRQNFNGVPFFILGQKDLDCQFGKNRKKTPKDVEGKVEVSPQGTYTDSKPVVLQPTKKRDCPAKCVIREICKFPTYRVDSMPTKDEKNMINMDVIRKCRSGVDIPYERTFILCLPFEEDHTCEPGDETHPSVRIKGTETNYTPVQCFDPLCADKAPHMHCPFCVKTESYTDPVILKAHYRVKHVDKGIEFAGLKVLRCCDRCDIVGVIKGEKKFKGAHWHCYKCRNGFNRRDEAIKHYKTHFRNPQTTFQIQIAQDINQPVSQAFESEEAAACIPTDSFSVCGTLAEGISTNSGNLTLLGRTLDGMVSMPGVGAVETVGVADTQTIMIIQDDGQGNLGVQELCSSQNEEPPDLNDIDDDGPETVQELREKIAQLEKEKAEQKAHIDILSKQIEEQAVQIAAYKVRQQGLLEQLHQSQQGFSMGQGQAIQDLCNELETQHKQLIRQQITQLKHSLVHPTTTQPKMLVFNANSLGTHLGQTVSLQAFDSSNNATQVAVALDLNSSNANEVGSSSIETEINEVGTTETVDDDNGPDEIETDKDDNFKDHQYRTILVQSFSDELDAENPIIENDGNICDDEPQAKRRKEK